MTQIPPSQSRGALQGAFGQAQASASGAPNGAPPGGAPAQDPNDPNAQGGGDPQQMLAAHEGRIAALETVVKSVIAKLGIGPAQPGGGGRPPAPPQGGVPPQGPPPQAGP